MTASVSVPLSFFPCMSTSLTHLISGVKPAVSETACVTATAAASVAYWICVSGSAGWSRMVKYTPVPEGETNVRPRRPRPPVCSSAASTKPCGRSRYCSFMTVLVEVMEGTTTISLPMHRV